MNAGKLLEASLAPNTSSTYNTSVRAFYQFLREFHMQTSWPINIQHVILFISWCFEKGLSSSTIHTYISGLNFFHKLHGGSDLFDEFIISKLVEGCCRLRRKKDTRLPITLSLLKKIAGVLSQVCYDEFEFRTFKAAFLLAYFGMFRVSEIVAPSMGNVDRTLKASNVNVSTGGKELSIILEVYKTNQRGYPITLKIPAEIDESVCPVKAVSQYWLRRPNHNGPFFCHANGRSVTRYQFSAVLAKCLRLVCQSSSNIKSHSFRIGRATQLAEMGVPGYKIKILGRWSSEAYSRYIRP